MDRHNNNYFYRKIFRPNVLIVYTHICCLPILPYEKLSLHFTRYEKKKLQLFKNECVKYEYAYSHFLLREIINNEYEISNDDLIFNFSEQNKPYSNKVNFNLSHSHGYIAFIFSEKVEVGIDVQQHLDLNNYAQTSIMEAIFSTNELKYLETANNKQEEFYKIWTQKEAYGKAKGKGLLYATRNIYIHPIYHTVIDLNHHCELDWKCETVKINKEATISYVYEMLRKEDV